jgi:hypothetical protein
LEPTILNIEDNLCKNTTLIKKSILSEIIKYKKYSKGFASRTFSKKSSGNSSHGLEENTNGSSTCGISNSSKDF